MKTSGAEQEIATVIITTIMKTTPDAQIFQLHGADVAMAVSLG